MTLKDSWIHFIFHICKCLLEFATRGKHDVRALDVFLGEQSLRSGSFAFQGDTECRSEERRVGKECRSRWSPYH